MKRITLKKPQVVLSGLSRFLACQKKEVQKLLPSLVLEVQKTPFELDVEGSKLSFQFDPGS